MLKYAVVVPKYDVDKLPKTLADTRDSFPQAKQETLITVGKEKTVTAESDEDSVGTITPVVVRVTRETGLPDFGQSPIACKLDMSQDSAKSGSVKNPGLADMQIPDKKTEFKEVSMSTEHDKSTEKDIYMEEMENIYSTTIDHDVTRMDGLLDQWCLDLKRNVLAEFSQAKIRIVETGRQKLVKEQQRHASEKTQLCKEIDSLKELLHTYEQSIERKDQVISNLTHAMQKQKEKMDMMKKFSEWKIKHIDNKREIFASALAYKHYQRSLCKKILASWRSVIEDKWRSRVERACQAKAQEVCLQLTNDYESKIASLNEALDAARSEVNKLHRERERYEEAMKKAFMRGVCALNLEAMTMFQPPDENQQEQNGKAHSQEEYAENLNGSLPEKEFGVSKTIPQEPIYTSHSLPEGPPAKVITSQGSRSATLSSMAQSRAAFASKSSGSSSHKGKVISAKITSKIDTGRPGSGVGSGSSGGTLAPPMSSVMVERHQPVSKQTIGHATAGKYPRKTNTLGGEQQSGIVHRRIAGQSGPVTLSPYVQTVKVVD
ncbi:hypothetical protein KUTeg_010749 [Tegillarca granosa]|uniref:Centrosomal protein POC5 n=1 Tax=Tegillarca granosa TaxID=220873 RepID=A0ABQ9F1W5_TEGGR|nr:hypothetical protein KUTeg_010749 [Tegillarca granosa]